MMDKTSYEENPCWEGLPDYGEVVPEDYDDEDLHVSGTCEYCGKEPWLYTDGHPHHDPFSLPKKKVVCKECYIQIIGGDEE